MLLRPSFTLSRLVYALFNNAAHMVAVFASVLLFYTLLILPITFALAFGLCACGLSEWNDMILNAYVLENESDEG